jgi:myo-inositol-1(or 4)-monophosphatase
MWEHELEVAIEAARRAGQIVREVYARPFEVQQKSHDNPVTEADLRANECIHGCLMAAFPDDGWLSEETRDSHERLARRRVWIIDPLDGTKEFTQHIAEFCICIALVHDGEPVVGVSYNPVTDELFAAARGLGLRVNGVPAHCTETADVSAARVLASRSEDKRGEWDPYKPLMRVELTGSVAFKLALIAAGRADGTFSLTPKHEWDVCAGAALIIEGGGRITDCHGRALRFNSAKPLLPGIIATNAALFEPMLALTARVGKPEPGVRRT